MCKVCEARMSDKPREWPNIVKEARDQAAENGVKGIRMLSPVIFEPEMCETEKLRRVAIALNCLQTIVRILEKVGAQTTPIE